MKIHHIGYLVKKIDKAQSKFENLGYKVKQTTIHDTYRNVLICFMQNGDYVVELVSPAGGDSVVDGLIEKYRNSPYHICYASDNFDSDTANLRLAGYVQIDEPCIAPAINNKRAVFFMSSSIGLVEVVEI